MKKRILASTMASVMALSAAGTTLISSAAVADFKNNSVTKAELKTFLTDKKIVNLAENDGIEEYGSISGANFMKAYDFANTVVGSTDYNDDDATVAYLMLKAAKAALKQYNKTALAALVSECRPIYDTENLLNENNDAIYAEDIWSDFVDAFENAESFTDSDDIRVTTDAYEELDAVKQPKKKTQKTKKQIDAARAAYEKALQREFDFQPWQRGTVVDSKVSDFNGKSFAWGTLYEYAKSVESSATDAYNKFNAIKGITVTSDDAIVNAVNDLEKITSVLNSFKGTAFEAGSSTKTNSLLKKYHGQLVYTFIDTSVGINPIITAFITVAKNTTTNKIDIMLDGKWEAVAAAPADPWNVTKSGSKDYKPLNGKTGSVDKTLAAEVKVRGDKEIYFIVTQDKLPSGEGAIVEKSGTYFYTTEAAARAACSSTQTTRKIAKGGQFVISDFIAVDSTDMAGLDAADALTALNTAKTAASTAETAAETAASSLVSSAASMTAALTTLEGVVSSLAGAVSKTQATGALATVKANIAALTSAANAAKTTFNATNVANLVSAAADENIADLVSALVSTAVSDGADASEYNTGLTAFKTAISGISMTSDLAALNTWTDALVSVASAQTDYNKALAAESYAPYNNYLDGIEGTQSSTKTISGRFSWGNAYDSSLTNATCELTSVSLAKAMSLIEEYNSKDYSNIEDIDGIKSITGEAKGSTVEWKLIYNFTKYALEDLFTSATDKEYGYKDVQSLLDDAYKLATDTVETSLFNASHMALYDARNEASEWLTKRKVTKPYTDKETAVDGKDSTQAYKDLKDKYDVLNNEYKNFKYSYGDIVEMMAKIAKDLDSGKVSGSDLTKALNEVADKFIKVESVKNTSGEELADSEAFTEDGDLKKNNRLITKDDKFKLKQTGAADFEVDKSKDGRNETHYDMRVAYENLVKLYTAATEAPVSKVTNDVDGNGKFELGDVTTLLKLFAEEKMDVAKHDINGDGKADLTDVTALLTKFVNL